ncbi:MAG: HIT family protein [Acidimicrobiales bacterium]
MSLDHLWAGWRTEYISSISSTLEVEEDGGVGLSSHLLDDPDRCVFCRIEDSGEPSAENGVIWRGSTTFAVLNAYPYASGHLMVMPSRHVRSMAALTEIEGAELWGALRAGVAALEGAYRPDGVNLGANLGQAAGAGIPRHLHLHAVPRWTGDTNFMTAVAGIRVLPESLADSWSRLHKAWPV